MHGITADTHFYVGPATNGSKEVNILYYLPNLIFVHQTFPFIAIRMVTCMLSIQVVT